MQSKPWQKPVYTAQQFSAVTGFDTNEKSNFPFDMHDTMQLRSKKIPANHDILVQPPKN